jgi:hypothetical protein
LIGELIPPSSLAAADPSLYRFAGMRSRLSLIAGGILVSGLIVIFALGFSDDDRAPRQAEGSGKEKVPKMGFKEIVKNPDYWDEVARARQEANEAAEAARGWSDDQVAAVTRHILFEVPTSREAWQEAQILEGLGDRVHATVLKVLAEQRLYGRLVQPTGEDLLPEAPFNRACELLGDVPPAEAVVVLAPFLADPSEEIRKDAAMAIAKTGAVEIIPHVRKAFADPDEYVRSFALIGLEFSLRRKGLAESVARELFPDVKRLLQKG